MGASLDATARSCAEALLAGMAGGEMDPVAYDTAWVARLVRRGDPRQLLFPESLAWLLDAQREDGSWGAGPETLHDRIAATLAAITTLADLLRRDVALAAPPEAVRAQVRAGEAYCHRRAPDLARDPWETVGFELVVPVLLDEARDLGLALPWDAFGPVGERRAAKLARLPQGWRQQAGAAMTHTLEGWGAAAEGRLPSLRGAGGSCANSPSATAFHYARSHDDSARSYLRACVARGAGGVADVYPFDVFEHAWVLDHLAVGGIDVPPAVFGQAVRHLAAAWGDGGRGVGIASTGLEADADDTAVVAAVLVRAGVPVDVRALSPFRRPRGFACFPFERNPSVSANIHAAYALRALPFPGREDALAAVHGFLADMRRPEGCWLDKWHASPWYPTCRAVVALGGLWPELVAPAVEWLLDGQRADGSWGHFWGTAEETAYAVEALSQVAGDHPAAAGALARARPFLAQERGRPRPALWIGKGLYHPRRVVDAAVLAALRLSAAFAGAA